MLGAVPFLWAATRGYRLTPWRSPYLRWRVETYWGIPAEQITPGDLIHFSWQHRRELLRFLSWTGSMRRLARRPQSEREW